MSLKPVACAPDSRPARDADRPHTLGRDDDDRERDDGPETMTSLLRAMQRKMNLVP